MISLLSFAKADISAAKSAIVVKITSVKKAVSLAEKWIESIEQ